MTTLRVPQRNETQTGMAQARRPDSLPKRAHCARSRGPYVGVVATLLSVALGGTAHAGDADCLWRGLSEFGREQAQTAFLSEGLDGLKRWAPTATDWDRATTGCGIPKEHAQAAMSALRLYVAERSAATALGRYRLNSGAASITWREASADRKAAFRKWRDAILSQRSPDQASVRAMQWFTDQEYVVVAVQRYGRQQPVQDALLGYYVLRSFREESESRF